MTTQSILEIRNLVTELRSRSLGQVRLVDDVCLSVRRGEVVGLVGESGCGKTMTALSIIQLFSTSAIRVVSGQILLDGRDLCSLSARELKRIRGRRIGMIFQDPSTFLDPLLTIGDQITEILEAHDYPGDHGQRTLDLVSEMGLPDPALIARRYPHQLSGGQNQRALIAMAMACAPDLLIADEPTTALDVTVQAQILELMRQLRDATGTAVLLITHDLGVIAEMCDRVYVMYAGRVVETNTTKALFSAPQHPYTQGLLRSTVSLEGQSQRLFAIPGTVPNIDNLPAGCRFAPRCPIATQSCQEMPPLSGRGLAGVACWHRLRAAARDIWLAGGQPAVENAADAS